MFPQQVHFLEVLYALTGRVVGTDLPEEAQLLLLNKLRHVVPVLQPGVEVCGTALHHWAALHIQRAVRLWLTRTRAVTVQRSLSLGRAPSPIE
jgi:hypothetical protein